MIMQARTAYSSVWIEHSDVYRSIKASVLNHIPNTVKHRFGQDLFLKESVFLSNLSARSITVRDTGDGEPSEYELSVSGQYVGSAEYHNETGREMSPDEVKAVVDQYSSFEMRSLMGTMDYDSLLAQLG